MPSLDTALIQAAADAAMITYDEVKKTLVIPEALKTVGVKGDKNSRLITFSLPVKPDLVDLSASTTSLIMDFTNASGQTGQFPIADKRATDGRVIFSVAMPASMCAEKGPIADKRATDGRVIFSVAMPASMCAEKGTVSVGIRAYDAEKRCWMTGYGTMNLQDALDVTDITAEDPRYTLLEEVMARLGIRAYDAEKRCWMTGYGTMNLQDALDVTDITAEDPRYTLLEEVMARLGMSEDDMSGFLKKSRRPTLHPA